MRISSSAWLGILLILLGGMFLFDSLGVADFGQMIRTYWPVLLILAGLLLLIPRRRWWHRGFAHSGLGFDEVFGDATGTLSGETLSSSRVFGDIQFAVTSKAFAGGEVSTVLGDVELDLTDAELAAGEHTLRLSSVMGDIRVDLPKGMEYSVSASSILGTERVEEEKRDSFAGSIDVKSPGYATAERKLRIRASQVLGDIRIETANA
jgi:predicted membrane protein